MSLGEPIRSLVNELSMQLNRLIAQAVNHISH